MLTFAKACEQAKSMGATYCGDIIMNDEDYKRNSNTEFKFIHFFREDGVEVGYYTYSLREYLDNLHIFENGRIWGDEFKSHLVNIREI